MFTVGVQSEFSAAHYHRGAEKSCEQIHGHNYRVEVQIGSMELSGAMVVDFGEVRRSLLKALESWDHRLLNETEDFSEVEPTTEIICRLLYAKLLPCFSEPVFLRKVTVWETDNCWASYEKEGEYEVK